MIIGHLGQFAEFIRRLHSALVVCFFPEIVAPVGSIEKANKRCKCSFILLSVETRFLTRFNRSGVENTRLEAKAKDQGHKRKSSPKKKRSSNFFFTRFPTKGLQNFTSADLQNFYHSKNSAVLESRTEPFLRT